MSALWAYLAELSQFEISNSILIKSELPNTESTTACTSDMTAEREHAPDEFA